MGSARRGSRPGIDSALSGSGAGGPARPGPLLGAHMSIAGGHDRAVLAAEALACDTLQVFTKNTNQWEAKPLSPEGIAAFGAALSRAGVERVVAHASYLVNLGSPEEGLWERSIESLAVEVERAGALGIGDLVFHPGAHVGSGEEAGLERIALGLDEVLRRTEGSPVYLDLETTAGQGTCLGHRLEHLSEIIRRSQRPERLGVCLDTCHMFAAGYSLGRYEQYNQLIAEIDTVLGLDRVRVWHLNDSVKELGSRVDRHAGLGQGRIGLEPFGWIVKDSRFGHLPMILETPKGVQEGKDLDLVNLSLLRRFRDSPGR